MGDNQLMEGAFGHRLYYNWNKIIRIEDGFFLISNKNVLLSWAKMAKRVNNCNEANNHRQHCYSLVWASFQ